VLVLLSHEGIITTRELAGLMGSGTLIAIIGFVDDHRHIAARWRLLGHFASAGWGVLWFKGLPSLDLGFIEISSSWIVNTIAVFYLVWLLNLYNFMDGIDGIAGVEAISVALSGSLLYFSIGEKAYIWPPIILSFAVFGFLLWNFPRARIFMGDAGSGFLGIMLGLLSIQAAWIKPELFWCWLILLSVFVSDATCTLLRRLLRGDKIYEAHRSHAYQWASRKFSSHKVVTLAVAAINIVWLLPCAYIVSQGYLSGILGLLIAYLPVLVLVIFFKAGKKEIRL
jgi:Fuc2NAc and GlcNAc transferase